MITSCGCGLGFTTRSVRVPAASGTGALNWRTIPVEIIAIVISTALGFVFKRSKLSLPVKQNAGLAFMLLNAVGIATLNAWGSVLPQPGEIHISWIAVLILVYSMIAPASPRRMLLASLVAALMDPAAFAVAYLAGSATPPLIVIIVMTWPSIACARARLL